jgi:hypothetical protein
MKPTAIAVLALLLAGCIGWPPGVQSYWDARLERMCKKDGGVTVYERVRISKADIARRVLPMTADGRLSMAPKEVAHPDAPVYADNGITYLRDANPRVQRMESLVMRRSDNALVARWVVYSRSGGDFPTGMSEGTTFICPDLQQMTTDLHNKLFIIE